jgi:hypothetical protein
MFIRFESARVGPLQELLPVGAHMAKISILGDEGESVTLSPLMPQDSFRSALGYQRFDKLDITIHAYLGMEDACVPMLGHRQRLPSRLMVPGNQHPDMDEDTTSKFAVQLALLIPKPLKAWCFLLFLRTKVL